MGRGQGAILLLQFREQPDVLNGDDRLVGEGLEERNLPVAEGTHLLASDKDRPDRHAFTQQGSSQSRPRALSDLRRPRTWELSVDRRRQVMDVDDLPIEHCAARHVVPSQCPAIGRRTHERGHLGAIRGHQVQTIAVELQDLRITGIAETRSPFGHGVHDRLQVRRRVADHLEDLARRRLLVERLGQ
jgi:hypothetical protein